MVSPSVWRQPARGWLGLARSAPLNSVLRHTARSGSLCAYRPHARSGPRSRPPPATRAAARREPSRKPLAVQRCPQAWRPLARRPIAWCVRGGARAEGWSQRVALRKTQGSGLCVPRAAAHALRSRPPACAARQVSLAQPRGARALRRAARFGLLSARPSALSCALVGQPASRIPLCIPLRSQSALTRCGGGEAMLSHARSGLSLSPPHARLSRAPSSSPRWLCSRSRSWPA